MSTVHANTPLESLRRLETLALFAGEEIPLKFLRAQVASAVQIVIQLQRLAGRRSVASIAEVLPLTDDGDYSVRELFSYDHKSMLLEKVADPTFVDRL
jgi:pilus assembly protein CpaF